MNVSYRAELVGVFGCPIDENPTVVIQEAAFRALGLNYRYLTLLVRPEGLEDAFRGMRAMNFRGINLTVPHKVEALKYVDEVAPEVELIGATNTVVNENGRLIAYNTDGKGFVSGITSRGVSLSGKRIALLGAGGAARAVAAECALAGAASIVIIGRTAEKAQAIADILNRRTACAGSVQLWNGTAKLPPCDILINCTPVGLFPDPGCPDIDYDAITADMIVQDVIPNPADTLFLKKARERGAQALNGLDMLIGQAVIGFRLWTGLDPDPEVMKQAMIAEQNQG